MFSKKIKILGRSLLLRLTALYTIAFTLLFVLSFMVFYLRIYSVTMNRLDVEMLKDAGYYAGYLDESGPATLLQKLTEEADSEDPDEWFYRLVDFRGNVLAASDMSSWGPVDAAGIAGKLHEGGRSHVFKTMSLPESDGKARMISSVIGPDTILQFGESLEDADEYLEIFRELFLILTAFLIIASSIIGWGLAKRALTDIEVVSRTAEDITRGAYDRRVDLSGRFKETERLGLAINTMLDRIALLLRSMKEINENIAHDLRSPLARIRGIAEMTLTDKDSVTDYKEMAISTIEECDALIDMINTMLEITEAEAGLNDSTDDAFDVAAVISEACELFRPIADEKDIALIYRLPGTLPFRGSRRRMQRIVTNILENAIKYTPREGRVEVSAQADQSGIHMTFNDTGIGISQDDMPHIFDRFYRCDRSRPQGGVGLGLSLAKAYTEAMNGLIKVTSAVNRGSTVTLHFVQ